MASRGNRHCDNCIGTLSFPIYLSSPRSSISEYWLSCDSVSCPFWWQSVSKKVLHAMMLEKTTMVRRTVNISSFVLSTEQTKTTDTAEQYVRPAWDVWSDTWVCCSRQAAAQLPGSCYQPSVHHCHSQSPLYWSPGAGYQPPTSEHNHS